MSIYEKDGSMLSNVYKKDGAPILTAYDKDGDRIYEHGTELGIKIMSYNVGGWYIGSGYNVPSDKDAAYYALQNGILEDNDPDILCIQEYWTNFSPSRTAQSLLSQYFPYIEERWGNSSYFGRAICSKYPITNYTLRQYSNDANRYYDSCTITIDNVEYLVITTHFGLNLAEREIQVEELLSFLSDKQNFIVCGDFNTNDCLDTTGDDYQNIILPIKEAGYNIANCYGRPSTFLVTYSERPNNTAKDLVLDNIITPNDIPIRSAIVDTTKWNDSILEKIDHMPLIVTI